MVALILGVSTRGLSAGVDREVVARGDETLLVVDVAGGIDGVPQRDRHPEEALPADQPVAVEPAHPVAIAGAHKRGVELQCVPTLQECLPQARITSSVADIPLSSGHDLQRLVALFEEVCFALGLGRLAVQVSRVAQRHHDGLACTERGLASQLLGIQLFSGATGDPLRSLGLHAATARYYRSDRQVELSPPRHVRQVSESAAHGDAGTFVLLGQRVRHHRDLDAEERGGHGAAEQRLIALVVGVGDQRDHGRDEFRAGRLDVCRQLVLRGVERDPVVGAGVVAGFEFGLGYCRLEGDIPQAGGVRLVGLAALQVAEEGLLGDGS